jgi:hypothetical protein
MSKNVKSRVAFEVLMILLALGLFCVITRIWPLLFLVIPGILIASLRLLFLSAQKPAAQDPAMIRPEPPRPATEQDILRVAYGILQRRITEQVVARYPAARWVWDAPNAIAKLARGEALVILLSQAGGFRRAAVQVHNLQFRGLLYETVTPEKSNAPEDPPLDEDGDSGMPDEIDGSDSEEPVDYSALAFEWIETSLPRLNELSNEAIAEGKSKLLIPADMLPCADSWDAIRNELIRNGFAEAVLTENGIQADLPHLFTPRNQH